MWRTIFFEYINIDPHSLFLSLLLSFCDLVKLFCKPIKPSTCAFSLRAQVLVTPTNLYSLLPTPNSCFRGTDLIHDGMWELWPSAWPRDVKVRRPVGGLRRGRQSSEMTAPAPPRPTLPMAHSSFLPVDIWTLIQLHDAVAPVSFYIPGSLCHGHNMDPTPFLSVCASVSIYVLTKMRSWKDWMKECFCLTSWTLCAHLCLSRFMWRKTRVNAIMKVAGGGDLSGWPGVL